jgi:hypothetical protein
LIEEEQARADAGQGRRIRSRRILQIDIEICDASAPAASATCRTDAQQALLSLQLNSRKVDFGQPSMRLAIMTFCAS